MIPTGSSAMRARKKTTSYIQPSRERLIRSVVTSTAIETEQSPEQVKTTLDALRDKLAHLRLAN